MFVLKHYIIFIKRNNLCYYFTSKFWSRKFRNIKFMTLPNNVLEISVSDDRWKMNSLRKKRWFIQWKMCYDDFLDYACCSQRWFKEVRTQNARKMFLELRILIRMETSSNSKSSVKFKMRERDFRGGLVFIGKDCVHS